MAPARFEPLLGWLRVHRVPLAMLFVGVWVPLCVFGLLAEEVADQEGFSFDLPLLLFLHGYAAPWLDQTMLFCTRVGSRWFLTPVDALVFLILVWRRRWVDALYWVLAVAGAALLDVAAKGFFARARPDLWPSLAPETTFSFPSGHSMGSMAFAMALIVLTWRTPWRWMVLVGAGLYVFLVGLSRVYLGVHYPSDVLGGWAAAMAWVVGLGAIFYKRPTRPAPVLSAG